MLALAWRGAARSDGRTPILLVLFCLVVLEPLQVLGHPRRGSAVAVPPPETEPTTTTSTSVSVSSTTSTSTSTTTVMYEEGLFGEIFYFEAITGLWKLRRATEPNATHVFSTVNIGYGTPNRWSGVVSQHNNFGIKFSGRLKIETRGLYDFELESDDGSHLYLNNGTGEAHVVKNGGLHGMRTRAGQMWLDSGEHDVRIDYFDRRSTAGVTFRYSGPDTYNSMVVVPSGALDHRA